MKKQLLIAAVAATMVTTGAMADISITGGAKVNYTNVSTGGNTFKHDVDLTVAGKSGDTAVSVTVSNAATTNATTSGLTVENVTVSSSIAGVSLKMGQWAGADSLLSNGSRSAGKLSASTSFNGVKVTFDDSNNGNATVAVSGSVAGAAISHKIAQTSTDTKVSGTIGGVKATYRSVDADAANSDKTSLELSTEMNGVTITYAQASVDGTGTTASDAFFGATTLNDASGFGLKTSLAGNSVNFKSYDVDGTDTNKVIVTRPLASGATFEATYTDSANVETLDLELAVKF